MRRRTHFEVQCRRLPAAALLCGPGISARARADAAPHGSSSL
jgi:hypothetical protein